MPMAIPPRPETAVSGALRAMVVRMNSSDSIARSLRAMPAVRLSGTSDMITKQLYSVKLTACPHPPHTPRRTHATAHILATTTKIPGQRPERLQHFLVTVVRVAAAWIRQHEDGRIADSLRLQPEQDCPPTFRKHRAKHRDADRGDNP